MACLFCQLKQLVSGLLVARIVGIEKVQEWRQLNPLGEGQEEIHSPLG